MPASDNRALTAGQIQELARPEEGPVAPPPPPESATRAAAPPPVTPPVPQPANVKLIDMTISLYKPVTDAAERQRYEALFSLFADSLYEVSNGLHKVRNITFYDSGRFSRSRRYPLDSVRRATPGEHQRLRQGRGTVFMGDAIFDQQTNIADQSTMADLCRHLCPRVGSLLLRHAGRVRRQHDRQRHRFAAAGRYAANAMLRHVRGWPGT